MSNRQAPVRRFHQHAAHPPIVAKDQFGVADTLAVDSDAVEYLRRLPKSTSLMKRSSSSLRIWRPTRTFVASEPAVIEVKLVDALPRWIGQ